MKLSTTYRGACSSFSVLHKSACSVLNSNPWSLVCGFSRSALKILKIVCHEVVKVTTRTRKGRRCLCELFSFGFVDAASTDKGSRRISFCLQLTRHCCTNTTAQKLSGTHGGAPTLIRLSKGEVLAKVASHLTHTLYCLINS